MSTRDGTVLLNWIKSLREAAWAPLLIFAIHLLAFRVFNAYKYFPDFDVPMHVLGGLVMAFFLDRAFISASQLSIIGRYHPITHRLLVFTSTCTVAVSWEFAEYGTEDNNLGDLFWGAIGALFYITLFAVLKRSRVISFDRKGREIIQIDTATNSASNQVTLAYIGPMTLSLVGQAE
jgi:hypothetical protein